MYGKHVVHIFPRGDYMKQMHLRVDDALYEELNTYSVETEQSMQACVREAVAYYITDKKKKQIPVLKSQFTLLISLRNWRNETCI